MLNDCNALDLANDHGHSQIAEFLLSKGAKVHNCKKVSSALIILAMYLYVTEYWKTDHVRIFGQLLFIGPANSHTHTLPVHCCINGLS